MTDQPHRPQVCHPVSETHELDAASLVLRALAHPVRLQVVCSLLRHPSTLTEMMRVLSLPGSTLSQHLRMLRQAGIIRGVRHGREVRFTVSDDRAQAILSLVCPHAGSHVSETNRMLSP